MTNDREKLDAQDARRDWALARYEVISAYLVADPPRGQREPMRRKLAERTWIGPDGEPFRVAAETIRTWVRRYRKKGLKGLLDAPRPVRGVQVLTADQVDLICSLRREVPERSLDRLITIAEELGKVPAGVLHRSTVHRVLRAHGLSARPAPKVPDAKDLDRFEAAFSNDLWQSDLLVGPWLPDPERPGKVRRALLYAFLDDHSRLVPHGRFSFRDDLPVLELVFRRCVQRYGVCNRVYYDNAQVYRSDHMREIVALLGIHRIVFTRSGRPMGHGKIEALNRLIRRSFLAELKPSRITTLDALNEAFLAWADRYNRTVHTETGQTPLARWQSGAERIRYVDEELLRQAFLWRERRTPDKTGVFSLLGTRYQVRPEHARRQVEVRFDPEAMHEVEVYCQGKFVQRARPLEVHPWRRPGPRLEDEGEPEGSPPAADGSTALPVADWLGHLVAERRRQNRIEPSPHQLTEQAHARRQQADQALLDLLSSKLDPDVVDEREILAWLGKYGPLDPDAAAACLDRLIAQGQRTDLHVGLVLEALLHLVPASRTKPDPDTREQGGER